MRRILTGRVRKHGALLCDVALLLALLAFLAYHIPLSLLLKDTLTVGGDTPAHNYLAGHLKQQLFHHGRIVSWAPGWWCGFPMFQFYFCLPYVFTACLSLLLPFNVAFKLVSVSGIFLLVPASYVSGRLLRLPRPCPLLLAVAAIPFLFVRSHTMWGVNIFSTLAGMIANSVSFPLMLLAVASTSRDLEDETFRLRSALLLAALCASHFFTTIIAATVLTAGCALRMGPGFRRRVLRLASTGGLALLLMAWWLIPLVVKRDFSVDFGTNWTVDLLHSVPAWLYGVLPFAMYAVWRGLRSGSHGILLFLWMFGISLFLFLFGFRLSPVFVNVRLWPFMCYAPLALGAVGLGLLARPLRAHILLCCAVAAAAMLYVSRVESDPPEGQGSVRSWAHFNYAGLEAQPAYSVYRDLVLPLQGTPGRLANDLSGANNAMGSSRIFESVPHVIGKPVLEGGLVNSAIGSLFSYYVQGETSENCAGFPPLVEPATFNMQRGTRHLELFNVKHFIARWDPAKKALATSPDWALLKRSGQWQLYELLTHEGRYVSVPDAEPYAISTGHWKACALQWVYTMAALEDPCVFLAPGAPTPPRFAGAVLTEDEFLQKMHAAQGGIPPRRSRTPSPVSGEEVLADRIRFRTTALGKPHIIKCTYYPNWKVRGAEGVYMVSPAFMLVYPTEENVELYYGSTTADHVGRALTLIGWSLVAGMVVLRVRRRRAGRK